LGRSNQFSRLLVHRMDGLQVPPPEDMAYYIKEIHYDPTGGALFSRRCLHRGKIVFEWLNSFCMHKVKKVAMLVLFSLPTVRSHVTRVSKYLTN